jgi:putative ribosome biogenesis GTPase RsgA
MTRAGIALVLGKCDCTLGNVIAHTERQRQLKRLKIAGSAAVCLCFIAAEIWLRNSRLEQILYAALAVYWGYLTWLSSLLARRR